MLKRQVMLAALVVCAAAVLFSCGTVKVEPPVAKVEPKVDVRNGAEMVDNYYWLRDRDSSYVIDYLTAENEYADAVTAHTDDLKEELFQEIKGRIKETDLSVPVRHGDYLYYSREEEGKEYNIYCRKKGEDGDEEILLDINVLAEGQDYFYLGAYEISPNHELLAYAYDTAGREKYIVRVKDLESGELLPDIIEDTDGDLVWANDNKTLFYGTQNETLRPDKCWKHVLGGTGEDELVYEEPDESFYMGLGKSRSEQYIFIGLGSAVTNEYHYLDADKPNGKFKVIAKREHEVEYSVEHHGNYFYIVTNDDGATNFKVVRAPVSNPSKRNWKEFIPYDPKVKIESVDAFKDYMVIESRVQGLPTLEIRDMKTGKQAPIPFDEAAYTLALGENPEYDTDLLRFTYISMVTPRSVYDINMKTGERELLKQQEVLGGYDPSEYKTERIFATADDGAQVPLCIMYKRALLTKDGTNPCYLYGYGAYGIDTDPWFSSARLSLVNRGFIFAVAQVRGGGEMGRQWYEDGKYLHKKNTFTDFIACGDYLVTEKYTSHDKMVIVGGSAGGLLIGAVVNMRPDLCAVAVAEVPFVDLINTMWDETIPLTVIEWEEWGNPHEKEFFDHMYSYSPYDQVKAHDYPNMLITAGLNDPRVQYWEPAKWTAKLRATKTDTNTILFKTVMEGGHFGTSGRYRRLHELAFEFAFILDKLGMAG